MPHLHKALSLPAIKFWHTVKFKAKPYNFLLITGLIFFISSFFFKGENNIIDIHLHDTYFIIAHTHIFWTLGLISIIFWQLYLITNRLMYSKKLILIHTIITLLTLALIGIALCFIGYKKGTPRRYYEFSNLNSPVYETTEKVFGVILFILLCGQILYVANFILGLIKSLRKIN